MLAFKVIVSALYLSFVTGREFTDEEFHQLPELFHLDDYERCLAADGVYCLGSFHLSPLQRPHHVYQLMEEYSSSPYAFNHTLVHRGYCVTSRCPEHNSSDPRQQFQLCAADQFRPHGFHVELTTLEYCHREEGTRLESPTVPMIVFLVACAILLAMNVIGTVYDVRTRDNTKRNRILLAWSVIKNWKFLTDCKADAKQKSPALTALHGIRVCVAICTCVSHSALIYFSLYLNNPRAIEKIAENPLSMMVQNSTASEQMFVVISGFLYTYGLRVFAEKHRVSFRFLPMFIAKRIIRLSPVYFLVLGFAATWWPVLGSGPLWAAKVGAEAELCRDKFWTHLLFVNNLVKAERQCVLPTWYMAVDVQMHVLSTVVLLVLAQFPKRTLVLLCALFAASCAVNAVLVYLRHWLPMLYLAVSSEILRKWFRDVPSYVGLYISPWGSMTACFLGLILGHLYYERRDGDFFVGNYKWLLNLACLVSLTLLVTWILLGYWLQHVTATAFVVAYAAMERSIFQILCVMSYALFSIMNGFVIRVLAWRGWRPLSRMSLCVMTLHWIVNLGLVARAHTTLPTSLLDILMYGVTTAIYTFLAAVPITILVELPMKSFFDIVSSS